MSTAWNSFGNYNSVDNFKIKDISRIIASDTHPDSIYLKKKVEKYKQLLATNKLEIILTCADTKKGTIFIDGTHRVVSYYEYNAERNNSRIELDVYIIRPKKFWLKLEQVYRLFTRLDSKLFLKSGRLSYKRSDELL